MTLEICLHFTHWSSQDYLILWIVAQIPVLTAAWAVVNEVVKLNKFYVVAISSGLSFFFAVSVLAQLPYLVTPGIVANDINAACELTLGLSLCFAAAFSDRPLAYGTLSAMWMLLALFGFCFIVYSDSGLWKWFNEWVPRTICIAGFTVIGITLTHGKRSSGTRELRTPPLSTVSR